MMNAEITNPNWDRKKIALTVIVGILVAIAYLVGNSVGQRSMFAVMRGELNSIQGMMAFNRIVSERKLQTMLSRGCIKQASNTLDIDQDLDREILSKYVIHDQLDARAVKYITDRDPKLLGELKTFKSKYGNSWLEPECK